MYYIFAQVCAGGKLYNVVLGTENTGNQLLQSGDLRKRMTFITLNKIQSYPVPFNVQKDVNLVGKGNVEVAISLVDYDHELQLCFMTFSLFKISLSSAFVFFC